jgi:hypothetical protein
MFSAVLGQVLRAVLGAAVDAFNAWRTREALKDLGRAEAAGEAYENQRRTRGVLLAVAHRLHTDPSFAKRVRDEFASR